MSPERTAELADVCKRMQTVSNAFYYSAINVGNHAFIEFCGLMNEYIKVCEHTLEAGEDFTATTAHGQGIALRMEDFHRRYLAEKLGCIFATSFPDLMRGSGGEEPMTKQAMRQAIHELRAEAKEADRLNARLSSILTHTANALKGEPAPLCMHDWSDLPAVAASMRAKLVVKESP